MTERVCDAKAWRRSTTYQPTMPASTATIVPAASALTMNGNVNSWRRSSIGLGESVGIALMGGVGSCGGRRSRVAVTVMVGRIRLADHDEAAVGRAQDLDRGAVQLGQRRGVDDLGDVAGQRVAPGEVHHAIQV